MLFFFRMVQSQNCSRYFSIFLSLNIDWTESQIQRQRIKYVQMYFSIEYCVPSKVLKVMEPYTSSSHNNMMVFLSWFVYTIFLFITWRTSCARTLIPYATFLVARIVFSGCFVCTLFVISKFSSSMNLLEKDEERKRQRKIIIKTKNKN